MSGVFASPETSQRVLEHLQAEAVNGRVKRSLRELANALGIGRNTVHSAIKRLTQNGTVTVIRLGTGDKYPSTYEINESAVPPEGGWPQPEGDA